MEDTTQKPTESIAPADVPASAPAPAPGPDGDGAEEQLAEYGDKWQEWAGTRTAPQWKRFCLLVGAALGSVCGALILFFGREESLGMLAYLAALVIALTAPRVLENRLNRDTRKVRVALLVVLGLWLAAFAGVLLLSGEPLTK